MKWKTLFSVIIVLMFSLSAMAQDGKLKIVKQKPLDPKVLKSSHIEKIKKDYSDIFKDTAFFINTLCTKIDQCTDATFEDCKKALTGDEFEINLADEIGFEEGVVSYSEAQVLIDSGKVVKNATIFGNCLAYIVSLDCNSPQMQMLKDEVKDNNWYNVENILDEDTCEKSFSYKQ